MREQILLDTDIGNDIDDAVCLAYLLAQPRCELVGITTVSGESRKRAMVASVMCKVANQDIPIYPGTESPLFIEQKQPKVGQNKALETWEHEEKFPEGEAVDFLREVIRSSPHKITLLGIGPMTNIGMLFSIDPEIPRLLKGLYIMCGHFFQTLENVPSIEWNAKCDPHAAAIVYDQDIPVHKSVGLDVSHQVIMLRDELLIKCDRSILRPVVDLSPSFFEKAGRFIFHDPLAASTIFDDAICSFIPGRVHVDITHEQTLGKTSLTREQSLHMVAETVDTTYFLQHFFKIIEDYEQRA